MDTADTLTEALRAGDVATMDALADQGVPMHVVGSALEVLFETGDPRRALRSLVRSRLGTEALPELVALGRLGGGPGAAHKDNLDHSIRVCAQAPRRSRVRWAALLHDVGKAVTKRQAGEVVSFHYHESVGARLITARLPALGVSDEVAREVATIVVLAGRVASYEPIWTDAGIRRISCDAGDLIDDVTALARADCTSRYEERRRAAHRRVDDFIARREQILSAGRRAARRPVLNGAEIMDLLGVSPGPVVGAARRHLLELAEREPDLDAERAAASLRRWHAGLSR